MLLRAAYSQKRKIDINDGKADPAGAGNDPFKAAEEAGKSK